MISLFIYMTGDMVRYFYRPYPLLSFSPNTVPSVAFLSPAEAYPLSHVPQDDPQVVEYHSDILIFHFPNHLNSKINKRSIS